LGTTVKGGYDSIEKISELQKKYDFWLHGDGAWGGAVIFNDELKQKFLPKLDAIDSFTMDFHKMLGTNLVCNFLLTKNNLSLKNTCASGNTSYIFYDCENDLGAQSLQCAKKVDSLKWFLDWKFYGKSGFAKRVKEYYLLAQYGEKIVENNPNLELVFPVLSFNICFRFLAHNNIKEEHNNEINQKIRTTLQASNRLLISTAYIENKLVFRLLISNINTTKESLEQTIDIIVETGKEELKNTQIGHK
jgi:glutamate/tyrosine decarboxylase-like PLP-dependent enzyme